MHLKLFVSELVVGCRVAVSLWVQECVHYECMHMRFVGAAKVIDTAVEVAAAAAHFALTRDDDDRNQSCVACFFVQRMQSITRRYS